MDSDDLTTDRATRLLAAITETERIARAASGPVGEVGESWIPTLPPAGFMVAGYVRDHCVRNDPRTVLAHCAIYRKIVESCALAAAAKRDYDEIDWSAMPERGVRERAYAKGAVDALNDVVYSLLIAYGLISEEVPDGDHDH